MAAMTASASRSCGTAFGWTNEVTSMRGTPASLSRSVTSTFASVGMNSGSIWNPSRVPTSQRVSRAGRFTRRSVAAAVHVEEHTQEQEDADQHAFGARKHVERAAVHPVRADDVAG